MVNGYGQWTPEDDYSKYPKEKWCDYDYMADWIRKQNYEVKTDLDNLISMIFAYYDCEVEDEDSEFNTENGNYDTYVESAQAFVEASGGLSEFDYWV